MMPMKKADIARYIHQQAGISNNEAARLLECILCLLKIILQKGEPIVIYAFGGFTVPSKRGRLA
jgi:integration host factor subunit alpha